MRISDWSSDVCSSDLENADQPRHIMLEKVAERVKERTNGEVEFQIFPSSQLGGQREMSEGVQLGSLEGTVSATSWMAGFNPRSEEHTSELQSLMRISYAVFCLKKHNKRVKTQTLTR